MTDLSTWDRAVLEELAAELNAENAQLRADLKEALLGWRWAAVTAPAPIMTAAFVDGLLRALGSNDASERGEPALMVLARRVDQLEAGGPKGVIG